MDTTNSNKKLNVLYKEVSDKTKKLTSALYRVTDLLSDREPIKWALRNKAVVLYDDLMSISFVKDRNNVFNEILDCFVQVANLLDLCSRGNSLYNLNFEILKKEYLNFRALIEQQKDSSVFEPLLLEEPKVKTKELEGSHGAIGIAGRIKQNNQAKIARPNSIEFTARKTKIFNFLQKEGPKTISDIAPLFGDEKLSVKTVQRDLLSLVQEGKLAVKGEKRWRLYLVKNQTNSNESEAGGEHISN